MNFGKYSSVGQEMCGLRGIQYLFKFENKYGASVVRNSISYGHEAGLYELAVLCNDNHDLCYSTPITNDVIGYLTPFQVGEYLEQIENLASETHDIIEDL